jgi:hypothetical protein
MKVYLVWEGDYEEQIVIAVKSTKDNAAIHLERLGYALRFWDKDDEVSWQHTLTRDLASIEEFEVDV